MYCHSCGRQIAAGSAFCPSCGAQQNLAAPRSQMSSVLVALALIFFLPLGIILMWTSTDWDDDVKWAISGILFPPLWLRFLWKVAWLPYAVGALLAGVTLQAALFGGISTAGAVAIIAVIAVILLLTAAGQGRKKPSERDRDSTLRAAIERKLDACHDLIAAIESDLSLEMLPVSSAPRQRYMRALEMRSEGQDLLRAATTRPELVEADVRLGQALQELRAIEDNLTTEDRRARSRD